MATSVVLGARRALSARLSDVGEIVVAHGVLTGGHRGRPTQRQGAALTRAGVVLLCAAMEAFVEDLFEESARLLYTSLDSEELKAFFHHTTDRFNSANEFNTNMLYFNLGMPFILRQIRWQKFSNAQFVKQLNKLVETRGQIAHGGKPNLRLAVLKKWRTMVEKYAERLQPLVSQRISDVTRKAPPW